VSGSVDNGNALTFASVSKAAAASEELASEEEDAKSISDEPFAPRIDDSQPPSVSLAAARAMELESRRNGGASLPTDGILLVSLTSRARAGSTTISDFES
jgi:hypothetical protein